MASKKVFLVDGYQAKPNQSVTAQRGLQAQKPNGSHPSQATTSLPKATSVVKKPQ